MSGPVRVLLVSPLPPPLGGMQTWTRIALARGLPAPFAFELIDTRAAVRYQKVARCRARPAELRRFVRIVRTMAAALGGGRVSVVHLNCSFTPWATPRNLVAAALCRLARVPYVVHLHGTFAPPPGRGPGAALYRWAYRRLFARAGAILTLGAPSARGVRSLGAFAAPVLAMPNFVDFRGLPVRRAVRSAGPLRVAFTGTLVRAKGIELLFEIARRLPDVRFRVAGDAPPAARAAFARGLAMRGLTHRVAVLGPLDAPEVRELLAASDAFVFPSAGEGFPFSVAEAMAAGLPVVASNVGAIPEMVDVPEGGYLLAPGDAAGFAAGLAALRDPARRAAMGRHNLEKARRNYDYAVVAERLCAVYRRLAGPAGGG